MYDFVLRCVQHDICEWNLCVQNAQRRVRNVKYEWKKLLFIQSTTECESLELEDGTIECVGL